MNKNNVIGIITIFLVIIIGVSCHSDLTSNMDVMSSDNIAEELNLPYPDDPIWDTREVKEGLRKALEGFENQTNNQSVTGLVRAQSSAVVLTEKGSASPPVAPIISPQGQPVFLTARAPDLSSYAYVYVWYLVKDGDELGIQGVTFPFQPPMNIWDKTMITTMNTQGSGNYEIHCDICFPDGSKIHLTSNTVSIQFQPITPPIPVPIDSPVIPGPPGYQDNITVGDETFQMNYVPPGNFVMGWDSGFFSENSTMHDVTLNHGFMMGETEITNALAAEVFTWALEQNKITVAALSAGWYSVKNNEGVAQDILRISVDPEVTNFHSLVYSNNGFSPEPGRSLKPMENISWYGALAFCNYLSEMQGIETCYDLNDWSTDFTKTGYRLPTEAEWEYSARYTENGFTPGNYPSGATGEGQVDDYCVWNKLEWEPDEVKTKDPNFLGLYDMNGNIFEWCWDWYAPYSPEAQVDPTGPETGTTHILRGSFYGEEFELALSSTCRWLNRESDYMDLTIGFRLARGSM